MIYGHGGTIHGTQHLHVETDSKGRVVAVWFRCMHLPFEQVPAGEARARDMREMYTHPAPKINAIDIEIQ